MSDFIHGENENCLSDDQLERYALRQIREKVSEKVKLHLGSCVHCSERIEKIRKTAEMVSSTLRSLSNTADDTCPSPEDLAMYLDDSVAEETRKTLETHLSTCILCQRLVVDLSGEVQAVKGTTPLPKPLAERLNLNPPKQKANRQSPSADQDAESQEPPSKRQDEAG